MKMTRIAPKEAKGLILVITGKGKGKAPTTLGIPVLACGHSVIS